VYNKIQESAHSAEKFMTIDSKSLKIVLMM